MRIKPIHMTMIAGLFILSSIYLVFVIEDVEVGGQVISANRNPILMDQGTYVSDEMYFSVNYRDPDDDMGSVTLYLDNEPHDMIPYGDNPIEGVYFEVGVRTDEVDDYMEFYFTADDLNGSTITLYDDYGNPFLVGDYDGWGDYPVLTEPDVYFDEEDDEWVFNVTYRDPDGDVADYVAINIDDDWWLDMETYGDGDPFSGQVYYAYLDESEVTQFTEFYFDAQDVNGSYTDLYDDDGGVFLVGPFLEVDDNGGGSGNGGGGSGGLGLSLPAGWGEPEVIVGLVALVGMAGAGGYGLFRTRKKRSRFSDLLTRLDDIYQSFKTNPHKCEIELEKMRSVINEDLKRSTIDDNNYNILKDRIDEIMQEIRSETLLSEVKDVPKDIEIRIKDMLIDGKLTREEYDKIMPAIKGSDMTSDDKAKMEKVIESWVKEDAG